MATYVYSGGCALGDTWVVTQYLMRKNIELNEPVFLSRNLPKDRDGGPRNMLTAIPVIQSVLDHPGRFELIDVPKGEKPIRLSNGSKFLWGPDTGDYIPTLVQWDGGSAGTVCYQFDGRSIAMSKNPPKQELTHLLQQWPEMYQMGQPMTIPQIIDALSKCAVFVGVCSGMSHIAHAVGCPMVIIEYRNKIRNWHPQEGTRWQAARGTADAIKKVNDILREYGAAYPWRGMLQ